MRRSLLAILTLAMFVAVGTAFANTAPTHTVSGKLKSIDPVSRTFTVETHKDKTESFKLADQARIEQSSPNSGKMLNLDQLKVGEQVKVSYSMMGQERMASLLKVMPESQAKYDPASHQPKSK